MPDYFTLAELRALRDMDDTIRFPDARCEAAAAYIVGIIEREVGCSFVPRTVTRKFAGGVTRLEVPEGYVQAVQFASVSGVSVPVGNIGVQDGGLYLLAGGSVTTWGGQGAFQPISVTYTAGYSTEPPPDIKEAALKGTREHLIATADESGLTGRRTTVTNEMGTVSFTVAGKDQPTGYPEVDATILGWQDILDIGSFA